VGPIVPDVPEMELCVSYRDAGGQTAACLKGDQLQSPVAQQVILALLSDGLGR